MTKPIKLKSHVDLFLMNLTKDLLAKESSKKITIIDEPPQETIRNLDEMLKKTFEINNKKNHRQSGWLSPSTLGR